MRSFDTGRYGRRKKGAKVSYTEQTVGRMVEEGVFEIKHIERQSRAIETWMKDKRSTINHCPKRVDMTAMVNLLGGESYRTFYLNKIEGVLQLLTVTCLTYIDSCLATQHSEQFGIPGVGLSQLPGNELSGTDIEGMSTDWALDGGRASVATMHLEDYHVCSMNYLREGGEKEWLVVPPSEKSKFEDALKGEFK